VLLESLLKQHRLIGQACAVGDRRPHMAALIVLDPAATPAWAAQRGIGDVGGRARRALGRRRSGPHRGSGGQRTQVSRAEQIRRFAIVDHEWTIDSGELTPTQMPRQVVHDRYAGLVDARTAGYDASAGKPSRSAASGRLGGWCRTRRSRVGWCAPGGLQQGVGVFCDGVPAARWPCPG
jgi:long-subunit acyl-CoA synthetase (AMP-forming)